DANDEKVALVSSGLQIHRVTLVEDVKGSACQHHSQASSANLRRDLLDGSKVRLETIFEDRRILEQPFDQLRTVNKGPARCRDHAPSSKILYGSPRTIDCSHSARRRSLPRRLICEHEDP